MNNLYPSWWLYAFLKRYEKFRPTAYKPTKNDVWTCGWGHTDGVTSASVCTLGEAEIWLRDDVMKRIRQINERVTVPLNQNQFDALASWVFNCFNPDSPAFAESTLLKKLNAGDYAGAAAEFPRWDKQAGEELEGLEKRREAEMQRFLNTNVADVSALIA